MILFPRTSYQVALWPYTGSGFSFSSSAGRYSSFMSYAAQFLSFRYTSSYSADWEIVSSRSGVGSNPRVTLLSPCSFTVCHPYVEFSSVTITSTTPELWEA